MYYTQCITAGVFGGLDIHGVERDVSWTRLSEAALAGSRQITLEMDVDWVVGDEIVIAPTGYNAWDAETMKITAITNNRTLTLNGTLKHDHVGKKTLIDASASQPTQTRVPIPIQPRV